ncbi:uncharacterized protein LOC118219641 [Anguilla anguilla]|uniref:uncharacterized protein LOC118219641 n=1 Tax=Anguilla anguilla TaxID=7936 RepID=UPI0015AD9C00|nr:uncharacterized protein LOC118219641 [Anguilla anguilla]XP_035258868.1 uncharacterized protein LOC118219641 [Anguilla anguilla]XP_035258869.1 uncharacterized protein LOC118219641 [Anguilla anguilla]
MEIRTALFFWLLLSSSAATKLVQLSTSDLVAEPCHSNVTLRCNVSKEAGLKVSSLSWIRKRDNKTLCDNKTGLKSHDGHRIRCSYTPPTQLALTFTHLWPTDRGDYICKLRSNRGIKNNTSKVDVEECYGKVYTDYSPSKVGCHFHGVYPRGEVHWFHRGKNVTSDSTAADPGDPNPKGMYNVSSTLRTEGDPNEYNCSLWIPGAKTYLASALVHGSERGTRLAGRGQAVSVHIVGLGWLLILAGVLIV